MIEIYKKVVLENYMNFKGRARRQEYWTFFLINMVIACILQFVGGLIGIGALLGAIFNLAVILPSLGVAVRRMHDVNKEWWYIFIPFYNLYLACTEGEKGPNQYGADPKNGVEEMSEIGKE